MKREAQDTLLMLVGVMVLQLALTDLHLRYVRPQMQPVLLVAGAVLTALAATSILRGVRAEPAGGHGGSHGADDGHGHGRMPRTAWLLALPLLVLTLVTPPSLGAYAAARGSTTTVSAPADDVAPLPEPVDGAVELSLTDFATRAVYLPETLEGTSVRLTGFVLPEPDGWSVARIAMSCCAADGRPVRVRAVGASEPAADSWVRLEGRFDGVDGEGSRRVPVLQVQAVEAVEAPVQQYE